MTDRRDVWVFIEQEQGVLADVSLELLGKGSELTCKLGSQVWALLCGYQLNGLAEQVIQYGADRVLVADHPALENYRTLPYTRVAVDLVRRYQPYIFLIGATPIGRDLAPRLASAVKVGLTADCTDLQIGDFTVKKTGIVYNDLLLQIRPAFGGNVIATIVNPETKPQMATVREGVMRRKEQDASRTGVVEQVTPTFMLEDFSLQILSKEVRQPAVHLKEAPVVVAGGGGIESSGEFELLRELASLMGGEVGASRAAVDAGYISREHQVGQTGAMVHPKLYIAAGISGAVQHLVGMEHASKIIAINTDPNAPIFQVAHYKIVGDLADVIPMLIRALREKVK